MSPVSTVKENHNSPLHMYQHSTEWEKRIYQGESNTCLRNLPVKPYVHTQVR